MNKNAIKAISISLTVFFPTTGLTSDICDDWWFSRNFYMDKAGYCFTSTLGKQVFDNSDCNQANIKISWDVQNKVDQILTRERENNCQVNTGENTALQIENIEARKRLLTQPLSDGLESICRYEGSDMSLRAGLSMESEWLGHIMSGDILFIVYDGNIANESGDWFFTDRVIRANDDTDMLGWLPNSVLKQCTTIAG